MNDSSTGAERRAAEAGRERKAWFFDRVLEKDGGPAWTFEPAYPMLDRIIPYEQQIEIVTGKRSEGLSH